MANSPTVSTGGVGFFGLLTIVLVTLKLLGKINISWFWAFSPIIFSIGLCVLILIVVLIILIWSKS